MAFEDLVLRVSPLTGTIHLGTPSADGKKFVGKKKDMTSDVIGAIIEKVGVGNQISVSSPGGKTKWTITVTDDSLMDISVVRKGQAVPVAEVAVEVPTKKKAPVKKKAAPAYTSALPPLKISPALQQVVGEGPMPRSEVVSKLWEYIKSKQLQSFHNRRTIICDRNLEAVFGKSTVSMFEMAGLIGKHVSRA